MRSAVLAAMMFVAGCNEVYGISSTDLIDAAPDADLRPDRDRDGIADSEDPCIAPEADRVNDTDGDGIPNGTDSCPFAPPTVDADGDDVDDQCDPDPESAGDRHLCTMRFLQLETTAALWKAREGEVDFAIGSGYLIGFGQKAQLMSFVAQERILPTTGTSTMIVSFAATRPFTFRVWISAQPTPGPADVACDITGDDTGVSSSFVGVTGQTQMGGSLPALPDSGIVLVAQFQPGKAGVNVLCGAYYDTGLAGGGSAFAAGHFEGPLGQQGFAVVGDTSASINAVVTYHRDDQPPLLR